MTSDREATAYMSACGESVNERDQQVCRFIKTGWQPFGSAYVSKEECNKMEGMVIYNIHCQPMVKYAEVSK